MPLRQGRASRVIALGDGTVLRVGGDPAREAQRAAALSLGGRGLGDALCEHPHLALGIGGREPTVSDRRRFQVSDFGSRGLGPPVQGVDISDVDVNQGRRMRPERPGAGESVPRLADHHQAVDPEEELRVGTAGPSGLGDALLEAERRFQVLDGAWGVFLRRYGETVW